MSLLPKRGTCLSCGHDHGNGFGSPDILRVLKARGDEVLAYQAEISDLKAALEAAQQQLAQRGGRGEVDDAAISAAMAEGNKHGVKSSVSATSLSPIQVA